MMDYPQAASTSHERHDEELPDERGNGFHDEALTLQNSKDSLTALEEKPAAVKKKRTKKVAKRKKPADDVTSDEENGGGDKKAEKKKRKKKDSKKTFERRNIKALLTEDKLDEATKNALVEEQLRLQRLQQAQRDAFANEVLRDFELQQLSGIVKSEEEEFDEENFPSGLPSLPTKEEVKKEELDEEEEKCQMIELSSDEEVIKPQKVVINGMPPSEMMSIEVKVPPKAAEEESDSSDIQILSEVEDDDEDDPDNSGMHTNDRFNVPNAEGKVVVNISEKNPDQVVCVADSVQSVIKPHQIGGVRFLYDNIIESPSVFEKSQGFGCILAHSMGLGKTLQIVTFCDVFMRATSGRHIMVIVPINTLQNWVNEFAHWLPHEPFKVHLMSDSLKNIAQRSAVITNWSNEGGVLLIGYELFRLLAGTKAQQRKKKAPKKPVCIDIEEEDKEKDILVDIRKYLIDPGPDLVICDEGHRIKNAHASISQVLKAIRTKRRVVLTGYPLQNNLLEYWCMVDFVRPNYLGTKTEFSNMFERPIQNGQCVDSTPRDVRLMMHRAHVLHTQLKGFVQRRSHRVLRKNLPPKYEHVLLVKMTPFQRKLYATFTENLLAQKSVANPLKAFAVCCKIWNHPDVLCNFLRKKEANEEFDLELEELATSKKGGGTGRKRTTKGKKAATAAAAASANNNVANNSNHAMKQETTVPTNNGHGFEGVPQGIMNGNGYDHHLQQQYLQHQQQFQYQQQQQQFQQFQQQQQQQQFRERHDGYQQQQQQYPNYPPPQYQEHMFANQGLSNQMYNQHQFGQQQQQFPGFQQQNQEMFAAQQQQQPHNVFQPASEQMQQQPMYPSNQAPPGSQQPLHMLQQLQLGASPALPMIANGNGTSPNLHNEGQGFDPFPAGNEAVKKDEISYDWANGLFADYQTGLAENSNKFVAFFKLLEETIQVGERMLLFSQSLLTLDLIEDFLHQRTIPVSGEKWINGTSYFRLDGSTPSGERDRLVNAFNKADALKIPLFLVSTRAGSLGINLVGANRVIIFDASWNPCHDSQAVCRVYRYGQTKPCYIYRLVSDKCLEKKIYDRQINKQGMSDRVVDEANPDNYLSTKDIHSLWDEEDLMFELPETKWNIEEVVSKCSQLGDHVLAKVLTELGPICLSTIPFTHESLLIDRKEKKLSRIEKRIAERSYEAERTAQISYTRPSYAAFYPQQKMLHKSPEEIAKSQNYIGCRKESWKPPPVDDDEFDPLSNTPPKAHPVYHGMGSAMPASSQPLHARPPMASGSRYPMHPNGGGNSSGKFPLEALARREGVKLQEVYVPRDIVIPTKNHTPIPLKAGQRVMLIKTPKGIYLRLRDQIVKIKVPHGLLPFKPIHHAPPAASVSSPSMAASPASMSPLSSKKSPDSKPDIVTLHSSGEDE